MAIQATINIVQFVEHGLRLIELTKERPDSIFRKALECANEKLKNENVVVFFKNQLPENPKTDLIDPQRNILLGIKIDEQEECIDMIDIKALDEESIKPVDDLAEETVQKVRQHLLAKKTAGIFISSSGSKHDARMLERHQFSIDKDGYMRIDGHRVAVLTKGGFWVLEAKSNRSTTIIRLLEIIRLAENEDLVQMVDEHDLVRLDAKGTFVDVKNVQSLALSALEELSRKGAENYDGKYVIMYREKLTPEVKQNLRTILLSFPAP